MRDGIEIKDAKLEHAQALAALDADCFNEVDRFDEAEWLDHCKNAFFNKIIVAAGTDSPILANLTAYIDEDLIYIESIAVSKNYRKYGAATSLFVLLIDEINAHNQRFPQKLFKTVALHVNKDNSGAKKLYEKLGFEIVKDLNALTSQDYMTVKLSVLEANLRLL